MDKYNLIYNTINTMNIIIYNNENINLLYLSPYVVVQTKENSCYFKNILYGTNVQLELSDHSLEVLDILEKISNGISPNELETLIANNFNTNRNIMIYAKDIINTLMKYCIIE